MLLFVRCSTMLFYSHGESPPWVWVVMDAHPCMIMSMHNVGARLALTSVLNF